MSSILYYGESNCIAIKNDGKQCNNKSYYVGQKCGVHEKINRIELPKNPNAHLNKIQNIERRKEIQKEYSLLNFKESKKGNIILTKFKMMKEPEHMDGYLSIFPNYKHGNRIDGLGLPSLSPKSIGPILVLGAQNLENLHQGNKVFKEEINVDGTIKDIFYARQKEMYMDKIPWRHKFDKFKEMHKYGNIPEFSLFRDIKLSYFESRQVYCNYYEYYVKRSKDFIMLQELINNGTNINIIGYDAYPITKSLDECYKDTSRPFGHELVLYSMLKNERIWEKYTYLDLPMDS